MTLFLQQVGMFPNAKHDEHIDLTCYGIERNLMSNEFLHFNLYL